MKILSLDLGARRIGVAISDGQVVASQEIIRSDNRDQAIAEILRISREEHIEKIVIGLPGIPGESADMVRSFALELNKFIQIPIEFVDETLTSKEAARILSDLKINPRSEKYKEEIDRISAKLILEQYLQENQNNV